MRSALLFVVVPTLAAAVVEAACTITTEVSPAADGGEAGPPTLPSGTNPNGNEPPPSGNAGTGAATGLPCDVQGVLENRCIGCHDGKAAVALLNYENLAAMSTKDPSKTMARVALELMKAKEMPKPPALPADDDEVQAFDIWVNSGAPKNPEACTDPPPPAPDGGAPKVDGGVVADGGVVCTSGKTWTQGNTGSPLMHPGTACMACHQANGGPNFRIAGTVYPTLREPNDCNGSAPPPQLTVTLTDSRNRTATLQVNAAGNFFTLERFRPPFKNVKVSDGTKTRAMQGSVNAGDCNSCHTAAGANGAPGRIMAP